MKKKILIVSHAMELGGVERSLLGLLDAFDLEKVEVDLFLLRHQGELLDAIPEGINLLPAIPAYTVLARPMKDTLREGHVLLTAARLAGNICAKLYAKMHLHTDSGVALDYSHKFTCPFMPRIQPEKEYDLAVSFLTPHYFVARKVAAKKKLAWIHTDYGTVQVDIPSETKMWGAYDYIASISDAVSESFLSVFPSLREKLILIENILPARLIMQQAKELIPRSETLANGVRLLSVGRYCTAKNFDNVPNICARLIQSGLDLYWYIIGFGGSEELIRRKIREAGMEDRVILLGKKENPYPYIKDCDLYVQPSRYEGKCVAVREAQVLGKPVVITNYATSASQLEDGVDGMIVPMDNVGCAEGIAALLRNPERMAQLTNNCKLRDYTNKEEVEKIYDLL
ncbi:MAG: glycosyltransferase [Oscillospiraceae bacterium]|nr:glycosyltransferase [Oscillospiraceae bacterium]